MPTPSQLRTTGRRRWNKNTFPGPDSWLPSVPLPSQAAASPPQTTHAPHRTLSKEAYRALTTIQVLQSKTFAVRRMDPVRNGLALKIPEVRMRHRVAIRFIRSASIAQKAHFKENPNEIMLMNEPQAGGAALGPLLPLFLSSIQRRRQFAKASARVVFGGRKARSPGVLRTGSYLGKRITREANPAC